MIKNTITCDKCEVVHNTEDDEMITQEYLSARFLGGYAAPFGDMQEATLDLCPDCQIELFGKYVKVK